MTSEDKVENHKRKMKLHWVLRYLENWGFLQGEVNFKMFLVTTDIIQNKLTSK